jgi:hypothetical protein
MVSLLARLSAPRLRRRARSSPRAVDASASSLLSPRRRCISPPRNAAAGPSRLQLRPRHHLHLLTVPCCRVLPRSRRRCGGRCWWQQQRFGIGNQWNKDTSSDWKKIGIQSRRGELDQGLLLDVAISSSFLIPYGWVLLVSFCSCIPEKSCSPVIFEDYFISLCVHVYAHVRYWVRFCFCVWRFYLLVVTDSPCSFAGLLLWRGLSRPKNVHKEGKMFCPGHNLVAIFSWKHVDLLAICLYRS